MLTYIAGAGAMGCRFGSQIKTAGYDVILLDKWEDHIQAIKERGLEISGDEEKTLPMTIMHPSEATEPADLIILFTKAMQLPDMLRDIQGIITDQTQVLCLLNGLGHEEVIAEYVKRENIMMGVTVWTAGLVGPGHAHLEGTGTVNLQSFAPNGEEKTKDIVSMLNDAKLNVTYDENVFPSIWRKVCVNGTMNSVCALLDCTIGEMFQSPDMVNAVKQIIHEFVVVAEAQGVVIDEIEMVDYVMKTSKTAAHHYPSMHQDLVKNHRKTEIDYINGAVVKLGAKHGIQAPYCQLLTELIHAKEMLVGIQ
ncbi:MAG: 2-dehydropantoate 2-reductase [Aerococcus sp.]|nr:2-dehydropantoate 2-reductase [Aerococcus sp.]